MKKSVISILIISLFFFSQRLFAAQPAIPVQTGTQRPGTSAAQTGSQPITPTTATPQSNTPVASVPLKKNNTAGMNFNYLAVGLNLYGMEQIIHDTPGNDENDVKFFGYDFSVEFQYLFRHLIINVTFDIANYNLKMYFNDSHNQSFTEKRKYRRKILNATLGYGKALSEKIFLVIPAVGFGYQDYDNPTRIEDFRCELYYLILNSRLYLKINNYFEIGFDIDFRIILSHIATINYQSFGNSRVILRKGFYFSFKIPMKINLSSRFFFSAIPWIQILKLPHADGILIDLDSGSQFNEAFYKNSLYAGGMKLMFGVYF